MIDRWLQGLDLRGFDVFDEPTRGRGQSRGPRPAEDLHPSRPRDSECIVVERTARLQRDRATDDGSGGAGRRGHVRRLRGLLGVRAVRRRLPGGCHQPQHARARLRGGGRRRGGLHRLQALHRRRSSPSTGSANTATSSRECRWTACSRRRAPSTLCCVPATARSLTASPSCRAPAHGIRRWATRCARRSAACTRSSRTS